MTRIMPASERRWTLAGLGTAYLALAMPVLPLMPPSIIVTSIGLGVSGLWLSQVDLVDLRIPDSASLIIALLGGLSLALSAPERLPSHLLAAAGALVALWLLGDLLYRSLGQEALGLGDAKLLGAGGVWVGVEGLPSVLLLGTLAAILYAMLVGKARTTIPFGPFLALAIYATWLLGPLTL